MKPQQQQESITELIYRLKTRLALANFKRKYGYERIDLYTLENNLLKKKKTIETKRHRYYPSSTTPSSTKIKEQQLPSLLYPRYPLSEKRSTSPQQYHTSIEAANVLVMLHNHSL